MEKYHEEFTVDNWEALDIGKDYKRCEEVVDGKRKKIRTDTGEIDIFALSKDKTHNLVIELKKGRASDKVIGQIQRYMGYIKDEITNNIQEFKGLIIGLKEGLGLKRAPLGFGLNSRLFLAILVQRYGTKINLGNL